MLFGTSIYLYKLYKDHKYHELDTHSSYNSIAYLEAVRGIYCLKDSILLHSVVSDSATAIFCLGKY
jgi:hypothetical protein